jgi:4-hydroxybenzoate polyprenyltransferase
LNTIEELVRRPAFHLCFSRILFFTVSSSTLISLTASMILLISFVLYGIKIDIFLLVASFSVTFAVYNLDRLVKQKEDLINDPSRSRLFESKRKIWGPVIAISVVAAVSLSASKGLSVLLTLLSPLLVLVGYVFGFPHMPRLKDIPGVKNLVLVLTWSLVPTILPNLSVERPATDGILLSSLIFYFIFAKAMINTILFDVRDIQGDERAGVRTLPVVLGIKRTGRILFALNATLILWIAVSYVHGFFSPYLPLLCANIAYGFWYIELLTRNLGQRRILTDLLVDGEWMPLGLLIVATMVLTRSLYA